MKVSQLFPIEFDDKAFDYLVLPNNAKQIIKSLVQNNSEANSSENVNSFGDIISTKGRGCIFLLHGKPGVGKSLTAEAIAEFLHRPLYVISVGELGTSVKELEGTLSTILELAGTWNAVLLIDEADIFLEARSEKDIKRNAMVGIFLRLLEYHEGVLFLTTNRVTCLDEAFKSRISVALHYPTLDSFSRAAVWKNLCTAAGITGMDFEKLAEMYKSNGREIRNYIKLATCLAQQNPQFLDMKPANPTTSSTSSSSGSGGRGARVTEQHIHQIVNLCKQFDSTFSNTGSQNL